MAHTERERAILVFVQPFMPPRRKSRRSKKRASASSENVGRDDVFQTQGRDLFSTLPVEILTEILKQTSTEDVLAVARCSKRLCRFLVGNTNSDFIWKTVRRAANLPEPTPNLSEAAYAAFVYDGGPCEVSANKLQSRRQPQVALQDLRQIHRQAILLIRT